MLVREEKIEFGEGLQSLVDATVGGGRQGQIKGDDDLLVVEANGARRTKQGHEGSRHRGGIVAKVGGSKRLSQMRQEPTPRIVRGQLQRKKKRTVVGAQPRAPSVGLKVDARELGGGRAQLFVDDGLLELGEHTCAGDTIVGQRLLLFEHGNPCCKLLLPCSQWSASWVGYEPVVGALIGDSAIDELVDVHAGPRGFDGILFDTADQAQHLQRFCGLDLSGEIGHGRQQSVAVTLHDESCGVPKLVMIPRDCAHSIFSGCNARKRRCLGC